MELLECVPNFSEGRDEKILDKIAACFAVPDIKLIHRTADSDHNRSVFTVLGTPGAVQSAVLAAVGVAADLIDMRIHTGVHPCIGAADVVPFVPLEGLPMNVAVQAARETAAQIWSQYKIPTYLYEAAATRSPFRALPAVREGGFAMLAARMQTAEGSPDFGGSLPHPTAGASAVGAREVLVAFNVNLKTEDVEIARAIARQIRARDGGMPCVRALGLFLPKSKCAQVSMNLTDYRTTLPITAFTEVERLAAFYGVKIAASELIGCLPRAAAIGLDAPKVKLLCDLESRVF